MVPKGGLEPPHLAAHEPESCVSTNFTTWAYRTSNEVRNSKLSMKPSNVRRGCRSARNTTWAYRTSNEVRNSKLSMKPSDVRRGCRYARNTTWAFYQRAGIEGGLAFFAKSKIRILSRGTELFAVENGCDVGKLLFALAADEFFDVGIFDRAFLVFVILIIKPGVFGGFEKQGHTAGF
jgi:hypothetical protein